MIDKDELLKYLDELKIECCSKYKYCENCEFLETGCWDEERICVIYLMRCALFNIFEKL